MTGRGLDRWRNRNTPEISADPERALEIGWPCMGTVPGGWGGFLQQRLFPGLESTESHQLPGLPEAGGRLSQPQRGRTAYYSILQHGPEAIVESGQRCHPCVMLLKCLVWFSVVSLTTVTLQGTIFLYLLCRKSHSSKLTYGYLLHRLFTLQPRRDFPIALPLTTPLTVWQAKPWEWR